MANANSMTMETGADLSARARPNRINRLILLGAMAILLNAVYTHVVENRQIKALKVGDTIPHFSLNLLDGGKISDLDLRGKPALYFFYAGWCPCSHASAPWIKKALADNAEAGLQAFGVGIQDKTAKLTQFARLHKLGFPVAVEGGQSLADQTGVAITPTTLFVDENGVIKSVFVGKIERYDQISGGLQSVLSPGAAGPSS